jgi:hypothetical protein
LGDIKVDQILMELHMFDRGEPPSDTTWRKIRAKIQIFHKERHHWACNGIWCVEYSWVSEDFLRRANGNTICGSGSGE